MSDIANASDAELEAELKRRRDERMAETARLAAFARMIAFTHIDALIALTPHGRTSCSDSDVNNGLGSADYGHRCTRCALLDIRERGYWPEDCTVTIDVPPIIREGFEFLSMESR